MKRFFISCILFSFVQIVSAQDTTYVIPNGNVVQRITVSRNMVSVDSLSEKDKAYVIQSFKTGAHTFYDTVTKMRTYPIGFVVGDRYVNMTNIAVRTTSDGKAIAVPQHTSIHLSKVIDYAAVFSLAILVVACIFWFFYAKRRHKRKPLSKEAMLPHGISIEKRDSLFPVFLIAMSFSAIADIVGGGVLDRVYGNGVEKNTALLPILVVQLILFTVIEQLIQNKHARVKK